MPHTRRDFLQLVSSGAIAIPLVGPLSGCRSRQTGGDALWEGFQSPPSLARPFFRWWWNGNRITADELVQQLQTMHEGGAGGIEINPIGLHDTIEPSGRAVAWLSDEWNDIVRKVADEAAVRGMHTDLIVGTGWPFGGEFLEPDETIQGVSCKRYDLQGPTSVSLDDLPVDATDRKILSAQLFPKPLLVSQGVLDLTNRIEPDGTLTLPIADGEWVLYIIEWHNRFRDVMYGAPGADGPVLDHFNRSAVEKYLTRMSDVLGPAMGGQMGRRVRSLFCDSIELEGANWTSDLPEVFEERRGYPLMPYLPLILDREAELSGTNADTVLRARFDFSLTLAELFEERFILPYHEWCNRNGVESRYQAYGHPWLYTDLLDGYLVPDIPEGDQWLFSSGWVRHAEIDEVRYAIWNKYASSGAHFSDRRIASSEAMTNTRGVFEASLEYIKQATDLNIVAGINHLVLHGYNHSPDGTPFPGWLRFGTYFHPDNPWWAYFHEWSDYAARLCWVFQEVRPAAQIGILGPTVDVWSHHGLDRNPYNTTPWYLHTLWQAASNLGYGAEYVNRTIVTEGTIEGGRLTYGPVTLDLLILAGVERLTVETAESLAAFAEKGGKIAVVESWPSQTAHLTDTDATDQRMVDAVEKLQSGDNVRFFEPPEEFAQLAWLETVVSLFDVPAPITLDKPNKHLFQIQGETDERTVFFLANVDRERRYRGRAIFNTRTTNPWVWDPESGERKRTPAAGDGMNLDLAPLQSLLLVFESDAAEPIGYDTTFDRFAAADSVLRVDGPWDVALEWPDGRTERRSLQDLTDLSTVSGLETFSGWVTYRTTFDAPKNAARSWIDLGVVHETAEVILNGSPLGSLWYGPRRVGTSQVLRAGNNELEIRVGTLLFNYARSLADNDNVQYFVSRSRTDTPLPTGLLGPVMIGHG